MLKSTKSFVGLGVLTLSVMTACTQQEIVRPNVVLIITDDQGYGDLGITGNPHVKTPVIDNFARESIRFNRFYVSPVCAPTRGSLMTGRYSLRTRIRDTSNGGAIMATEEITIAEVLKEAGYKTGIFGKWHLGCSYPFRPLDQGFDKSVIHLSGGMGEYGDYLNFSRPDSSYFNPVLLDNGKQKSFKGYCTDIYTEEALSFIEDNHDSPFFCYVPFNAPHTPLQVPDEYYQMYKDIDPASGFEDDGRPFPEMSEKDKEDARKVYAMVTNIDDNVGKILNKLDKLKIADNTIVIFMTDNGPQQRRYVSGMKGRKGDVYEGGVRVPFFFRFPDGFQGNRDVDATSAHIDILPTLAQLCRADLPEDRKIDGVSLLPLLKGEAADEFENRPLFFYWTRRYPELYNNMALQKGNFKLVGQSDYNASLEDFELYDLAKDEYEQNNILADNRELARELKAQLDSFIYELTGSYNKFNPPRIIIGSEHENPIILGRNDAGGERGLRYQEEVFGKWEVRILEGRYNIRFKFMEPLESPGILFFETNSLIMRLENRSVPTDVLEMKNVYLPEMECELMPHYATEGKYPNYAERGRYIFPLYLEMERINN